MRVFMCVISAIARCCPHSSSDVTGGSSSFRGDKRSIDTDLRFPLPTMVPSLASTLRLRTRHFALAAATPTDPNRYDFHQHARCTVSCGSLENMGSEPGRVSCFYAQKIQKALFLTIATQFLIRIGGTRTRDLPWALAISSIELRIGNIQRGF